MYTLFALAEYSIVLANIFFHSTLYFDFSGRCVAVTSALSFNGYALLPSHLEKDT